MRFTHIQEDAKGKPLLEPYFAILREDAASMPPALAAFAQDPARYALGGPATLRDSWLLAANIGRDYGLKASVTGSTLELRLLQVTHKVELVLRYGGVTRVLMRLHPDYQPDAAIDLMAHEVSMVGKQAFRHALRFDRGVYIDVRFREFAFEEVARA